MKIGALHTGEAGDDLRNLMAGAFAQIGGVVVRGALDDLGPDGIRGLAPSDGAPSIVHTAGVSPVQATPEQIVAIDVVGTARVLDAFEPYVESGTVAGGTGRIGTLDDIAAVVEFLVGPSASFITGTDLRVDGGVVAAMRYARSFDHPGT